MAIKKATELQLKEFLENHKLWVLENDKLHRKYVFADFVRLLLS